MQRLIEGLKYWILERVDEFEMVMCEAFVVLLGGRTEKVQTRVLGGGQSYIVARKERSDCD